MSTTEPTTTPAPTCSRCGGWIPEEGSAAWEASDGECPGAVGADGVCGAFDSAAEAEASKDDVSTWETVDAYVQTFPSDGADGACDVEVQIGEANGLWFLRTRDDAGGSDDATADTYGTQEDAEAAATAFAAERHEGEDGESAEAYLDRKTAERAGEPDPSGEWACYWTTALDGESRVEDRYATREQAEAAADVADKALRAANPGHLLCGYGVRQLVDGEWVAIDEES